MSRLIYDNLSCTGSTPTLGAMLTMGGTTITFPSALQSWGSDIATISSPDYLPLVIDPLGDPNSTAAAEVVWLTAYTSGATTGTVARAQEGSSDVTHANGVPVAHGPTTLDAFPSWFQYGSGSPVGSVTPVQKGAIYADLTTPAVYIAGGTISADWISVGGNGGFDANGFYANDTAGGGAVALCGGSGVLTLSDFVGYSGTGNSLNWNGNGSDGTQTITIQLGSSGQFTVTFLATGAVHFPLTISTNRGITSGALPTSAYSTTVGKQLDTAADRQACINPTLATTIALSPDNMTYTTVAVTLAAQPYQLLVPAGWYMKLTGDATYTVTYY